MGKKTRKNRFNKSVDVDVVYSSNTIADVDPTDSMTALNLSKEQAEELQRIRAKLPTFSQSSSLANELSKLPTEKPFRAFVHNMAFSATESDVTKFFSPLVITNINLVSDSNGSRGYGFVDFATRDDLARALERNGSSLAGRPVNVRIADPNTNDRGYGRDRNMFGNDRRGDGGFERGFERGFDRQRGGYRPAALRDENVDSANSSSSEWTRGSTVSRGFDSRPSGGFGRSFAPAATSLRPEHTDVPSERPKLNLLPRSTPLEPDHNAVSRNEKIFGQAKPVDTASKDREIEERLHNSTTGVH